MRTAGKYGCFTETGIQSKNQKAHLMVQLWELEYYDVISERMILEDGMYQFMAGASSQDIRLEQRY